MKVARAVASIGTLLMGVALVPAAFAQEAVQPNILLRQMTQPTEPRPAGSITKDDLRDTPAPPRVDKLRDAVRFDVSVGDARCFPGEEWSNPGLIRARRPSRSR